MFDYSTCQDRGLISCLLHFCNWNSSAVSLKFHISFASNWRRIKLWKLSARFTVPSQAKNAIYFHMHDLISIRSLKYMLAFWCYDRDQAQELSCLVQVLLFARLSVYHQSPISLIYIFASALQLTLHLVKFTITFDKAIYDASRNSQSHHHQVGRMWAKTKRQIYRGAAHLGYLRTH